MQLCPAAIPDKSNNTNEFELQMSVLIVPLKQLLDAINVVKLDNKNNSYGIVPIKLLTLTSIEDKLLLRTRSFLLLNNEYKFPSKLLVETNNACSNDKSDKDNGISPVNLLLLISKVNNCCN